MDEHAGDRGAVMGPEPDPSEPFVGRDAELARLFHAVDSASANPVVMLVGDMGTGKSALLDRAVRRAEAGGARVLRAEGSESEASLAFSALHQLLRSAPAAVDVLPERQRAAIQDAFGVAPSAPGHSSAPDLMLIGVAVLSLLSALGGQRPVLVVLDDAQWFDRASLDALSFVARRLEGEPVTMLLAVRGGDHLPGFDRHVPTLTLGPLDSAAANRLLDLQPKSPAGRTRTHILDQAGGNPLALVELTRAATAHDAATGMPSAGPLPLTDHLERIFAARLNGLPAATTRALLLLAAMDSVDTAIAVSAGLPDAEDETWLPAEQAVLVRRTGRDVRFRHPLVRSAVYHAASLGARREAHLALAEMLRDEPDRRAWHLAAACPGPDAAVSAELERTAARARRRGGHAAAAKALQRAAELAPRREDSARLLVEAASAAVFTGDLAWVEELAATARTRTDDASLLASAAVQAGRLAILTVRHTTVFSRLTDAAEELAVSQPAAALDLLAGAAVVRFYSGEDTQRRRIQDILGRLPEDAAPAGLRTWVRAVSDPFDGRAHLVSLLPQLAAEAEARPEQLTTVGIMAWLLDETPRAVRAFDEAFDRWELRGPLPEGLGGAVAWAYVERGRWDQAREACARTTAVGRVTGLDHAVACAATVDATVLAYQGHASSARARADETLALTDPLESRSVCVYARRALGAAAAAEGAYETAYDQLRMVFTADGAPVHYHASYPALADLAAAAVRSGRREEAAAIVERSARALADDASPRLRALISRARGLLADPEDAEPHFRAALADPVLEHWPFERAQTLLDFAERLRRRRRIAEARGPLTEALEIFRRLGAHPWIERARAESRAAGLGVTDTAPDALAELSPQQQQIIHLAARGLTNREIGERLFLSPRTVSSHLYRSFPKLGITARSQLRDLIEGTLARGGRQE
ncbi:DNA-binding CsgD family transcriptional regulator/molybdopterin-guanine dinucleotide biosynthesis protein [Streptomyces umbrinus]|uniref:helix-turn-helix transcriptional regulator n=1 Tax=Streptomyces umbrinus TaxID=67370 RepID=UPI00167DD3E8|nr:LuxR family transcriptional regulator [Streptomyces umbrinus]MCR3725223.1 DNA-binding CsgD family transcriptional regulator/molybdopterin-guanine dinucleotide biosynthesis protein [Streptomyces umbrinus]GHH63329.1 transcriptional regulator [Streptomyces umbrinus]